jgi:hypothetical protein
VSGEADIARPKYTLAMAVATDLRGALRCTQDSGRANDPTCDMETESKGMHGIIL